MQYEACHRTKRQGSSKKEVRWEHEGGGDVPDRTKEVKDEMKESWREFWGGPQWESEV